MTIQLAIPQFIYDFVDWINNENEAIKPCHMAYAANLSSFKDSEGHGWAVYVWECNQILLAGDISQGVELESGEPVHLDEDDQFTMLLTNIAHEYCHHLQFCRGDEPSEDEAEDFAYNSVVRYLNLISYKDTVWTWEKLTGQDVQKVAKT